MAWTMTAPVWGARSGRPHPRPTGCTLFTVRCKVSLLAMDSVSILSTLSGNSRKGLPYVQRP
jgi:hypothetical protein